MKKPLFIMIAIFIVFCSTGCKDNDDTKKQNKNVENITNNSIDSIKENDDEKESDIITIEFDSDGGTPIEKVIVKADEKLEQPQNPTKEGYIFLGWYYEEKVFDFSSVPEKNIVLKAKWQEEKKYEITFNTDGGSTVAKQIVKEAEKATQPQNPTKSGYKFLYWELNNKKYDFNTEITSNITLVAKWEKQSTEEKITYTTYKNPNAVGMWHCYTEESVLANKFKKAENVMKGDRIVCMVGFETYSTDKVKKLQYTLSYGNGLKLVKTANVSSAKKSGNTYSFTLKNPTSVGESNELGEFTFEVVGTTGLTYGIKDIKFTTTDNKNYSTNNNINTLKSTYTKYRDPESVGIWHCYTEESVLANKFEKATNVKKGDRIICMVGFETYSTDKVKELKYTLTYGSGLKLVKTDISSTTLKNGNTYSLTLSSPTSVGDTAELGEFTFEVTGTTGLTYGIKNVSFVTTTNNYYYTNDQNNTLLPYEQYRDANAVGMWNCYTEESVLANNYVVAKNVKKGDRIVCMVGFETYSTDKIKKLQYTLSYGSGLKLVKSDNVSSATKNGNTYTFTLSNPTSVGESNVIGEFTFEVTGTTGLTYGIKDISFVTTNNGYYYTNDNINSLQLIN